MTSLASLKTLNYFKTFTIINKLGSFYLVSRWQVLMFAVRGLSRNKLVIIEMLLSLSNWLYIIK